MEIDAGNAICMPANLVDFAPCRNIPDTNRPIHRAGCNKLARRAECNGRNRACMPGETPPLLAVGGIPQVNVAVVCRRHERSPSGAKSYRQYTGGMLKAPDFMSATGVP